MTTPIPNQGDSMTQITMHPGHVPLIARLQHIGEHLQAERARLEAELRYVMGQVQRTDVEIATILQRGYGIDAQHAHVTIDAEAGTITAVSPAPEPAPHVQRQTPEPEPEARPDPIPEPEPDQVPTQIRKIVDAERNRNRGGR